MRLLSVRLQEFRCFEDLTLKLDPQFTLLVGANGAGKTSVLDGLAVALGGWLSALQVHSRKIQAHDIRQISVARGGVESRETTGSTTTVSCSALLHTKNVHWSASRFNAESKSDLKSLVRFAQEIRAALPSKKNVELPVIAYFGTTRLHSQKNSPTVKTIAGGTIGSVLEGYKRSLESTTDHDQLEEWMAWRESVRLQGISHAVELGKAVESVREPLLEAVSAAVQDCIEGARRFFYSLHRQELRLELVDGRSIPFNLLSDGYRNLLTLVADIAWRAARLNPHHGIHAAARVSGVVLIDELDLHLHPAWQRNVIGDLRRTFPNIQFIATTHSPQVVSTAKPEWIRVLTADKQAGPTAHTYGRDSNSLLREVFGTSERPIETEKKIEEVEALLSQRKLSDARAVLRVLESELGPDDAIVRGLLWELNDIEVNDAPDPQGT